MQLILLALVLVPADNHQGHIDPRTMQVYDLAQLTEADAVRLQGRPEQFLVELDALPDEYEGWTVYDCAGPGDELRSLWLAQDEEPAERMVVKATLRLIRHKPAPGFPEFIEQTGLPFHHSDCQLSNFLLDSTSVVE